MTSFSIYCNDFRRDAEILDANLESIIPNLLKQYKGYQFWGTKKDAYALFFTETRTALDFGFTAQKKLSKIRLSNPYSTHVV